MANSMHQTCSVMTNFRVSFPIYPWLKYVNTGGGGVFYEEIVVVSELGRRISASITMTAIQIKLTHSLQKSSWSDKREANCSSHEKEHNCNRSKKLCNKYGFRERNQLDFCRNLKWEWFTYQKGKPHRCWDLPKPDYNLRSQVPIGFCLSTEKCKYDTAEGLSRRGVKYDIDAYICTNPRRQQWQHIASAQVIAPISLAHHC